MIAKVMGLMSREIAEFGLRSMGDNYATLQICSGYRKRGPEVIKLEYSLKLNIKRNDWLFCGHVSVSSQSLRFILSLRMNSSLITSGPALGINYPLF